MAQKLIELSANWPFQTELMWNDDDPTQVVRYLLHRSNQPGGAFAQIASVPNVPGSGQDKSNMVGGGRFGRHPRKIYTKVDKPLYAGDPEDLTWHYKLQRVDRLGNILTEDAVLANIVPRTILSFEETHSYYGVQGPSRSTMHEPVILTIPDTASSWLPGTVFVYDMILRHGRPAFRIRFRASGADVAMKLNNRNNLSQPVPVKVDDYTWDNVYDESYGGVWVHRLLFENTSGVARTVELDFSHGLQ